MTSYAAAGVDIDAGERAVELMKSKVARSRRPEVVDDPSGFAGLFDASALLAYRRPLLTTSTDGVGTKVMLAQRVGKHDTIGIDLVGMVVDDLVVCGAEPLFMTDYIACGKVVPERIAEIVGGVAEGCRLAGTALIGGETAEHPGAMGADEYDLAGAATGVVEADAMLGRHRVREGDVVLALASSGVHSNGYSLVRHIISLAGLPLERRFPSSAGRWARSCWSRPGSTPWTASRWPVPSRSTPTRTSPAAVWRATCPARSRPRWTRCWTARPGPRRPSSASWPSTARSRRPTWTAPSTWVWAWRRSSRRTRSTRHWPCWRSGACRLGPRRGRPRRGRGPLPLRRDTDETSDTDLPAPRRTTAPGRPVRRLAVPAPQETPVAVSGGAPARPA
nr:hypothetical protein GCM10020093_067730 [Planobispora longispora]